ncbi:hypothetical protein EVAR_31659_1 [Eumeta japonica]|uniref:Uncharacterized protein n=1 Tax=Eumeta variegata TaxID=151549 RepID=A0A4C1W2D0_EUMVA|nr:hypothetical protein EVAR_31659_1 [Eumeta japonica]
MHTHVRPHIQTHENSSTPSVIRPATDATGPLPLQLANSFGYGESFGPSTDIKFSDPIFPKNSERSPLHSSLSDFKLVDHFWRERTRFGAIITSTQYSRFKSSTCACLHMA